MNQEPPPPYPGTNQSTGKNYGGSSKVNYNVIVGCDRGSCVLWDVIDPVYPVQGQGSYQQPVIVPQPCYTLVQQFRETPIRLQCQFCMSEVITATSYEIGTLTWLACFVVFWFSPFGCCLIPFCMDVCKDTVHQCPNCHQQLGRYNRM